MAGSTSRPGQFVSCLVVLQMCGWPDARMTAELIFNPIENEQRRADQGAPVPVGAPCNGDPVVASNMRVMTS